MLTAVFYMKFTVTYEHLSVTWPAVTGWLDHRRRKMMMMMMMSPCARAGTRWGPAGSGRRKERPAGGREWSFQKRCWGSCWCEEMLGSVSAGCWKLKHKMRPMCVQCVTRTEFSENNQADKCHQTASAPKAAKVEQHVPLVITFLPLLICLLNFYLPYVRTMFKLSILLDSRSAWQHKQSFLYSNCKY